MRVLTIDAKSKARVAAVKEYAALNVYRRGGPAPGNDARYVAQLDTFRAVFSITEDADGFRYRHLSVSVPGPKFAHPLAVFMIASEFGFTGWEIERDGERWPKDWIIDINRGDRCVIVLQRISQ